MGLMGQLKRIKDFAAGDVSKDAMIEFLEQMGVEGAEMETVSGARRPAFDEAATAAAQPGAELDILRARFKGAKFTALLIIERDGKNTS
jgi:hypothetical protein